MTHEQADNALADAIWWFRGYKASRPTDDYDQSFDLGGALHSARTWLKRLARGKTRLFGLTEREEAVALTYGEFEVLYDALRERATAQDRDLGQELVKRVLDEISVERKADRDDEVFF